jgi:hypothetical protein
LMAYADFKEKYEDDAMADVVAKQSKDWDNYVPCTLWIRALVLRAVCLV